MHAMNNCYEECYESLWFSVLWRESIRERNMRKKSTKVQNPQHMCESDGIITRNYYDDSEVQLYYSIAAIAITCIAKP